MSTPILATKLYIPAPRPSVVTRDRLVGRLNDALSRRCKLTLISAPAGFGKTTLVSEWIAGCGQGERHIPAAWLSLDAGDHDPTRFLAYLVAALQTISTDVGAATLAALQSAQPLSPDSVLTPLLNELAAIPHRFILVVDDYHLVDAKPVDDALTFLLEHQPPQMHLVIATREDPSLPLARYRVRGQLTELRAAELRFTPAEAAEFLNRVMGLDLAEGDVAALESRTEGWIAGLQMAALSMQSRNDVAGFIQTFTGSHRYILDYLLEEVLHQQPGDVQAFLLRTSILNRLCGLLCDALLAETPHQTAGDKAAQETLEYLERANLFVVPLDNERRWYRYHHLFADLLRQQLERSRPGEIAGYHRRASEWYEKNGDWAEAFHHALAAGDYERAARLAEAAWPAMEHSFQIVTWLGWVRQLPDAVVRARPNLCAQFGWALSDGGDLEASETYLQYAEAALAAASDQEDSRSLRGNIALIRAANAQNRGDLAETLRYTELSLQLLPEDDYYLRASAAITLEFIHWATGDLQASLRAMYAWMEDMHRLGNDVFAIASAFAAADMHLVLGHLGEAEKVLREAIQKGAAYGPEAVSITAHHHLGLALVAHERGDDAATTRHMQAAAGLGRRTTLVDWPYRWNLAQARLKESAGEWDAALEFFDEAARVYLKNPIPLVQPVEARKARVYLKQGRLDKAQAWVRDRHISTEDEASYLNEYEHLTLIRVRLAERSFAGVDDLLERLLALAEAQERAGSVLEILVAQALVQQAQGNQPQGLAALERAMALAEPEGYLRVFVDEGEPMRLLREKQSRNRDHPQSGYANRLLSAFGQPPAAPQSARVRRETGLIEPLSERELEVLELLRTELSGPEIAEQLVVSLNTLRTHTKNIYAKLGVNNRRAAVLRAGELGLL